jgi:hypothetical protein
MKENWLLHFIKNNGFNVLVSIMSRIISKYKNTELKDTLQQPVEVEVLQIVSYMIRVILISCFCA